MTILHEKRRTEKIEKLNWSGFYRPDIGFKIIKDMRVIGVI